MVALHPRLLQSPDAFFAGERPIDAVVPIALGRDLPPMLARFEVPPGQRKRVDVCPLRVPAEPKSRRWHGPGFAAGPRPPPHRPMACPACPARCRMPRPQIHRRPPRRATATLPSRRWRQAVCGEFSAITPMGRCRQDCHCRARVPAFARVSQKPSRWAAGESTRCASDVCRGTTAESARLRRRTVATWCARW